MASSARQDQAQENFTIKVLRIHQKWGWLSNVMDFYQKNQKYDPWWRSYQRENPEFLSLENEKNRKNPPQKIRKTRRAAKKANGMRARR